MHVMVEQPLSGRPATARLGTLAWSCVSLALHALVFTRSCAVQRPAEVERPSLLPMQVEIGVADSAPGGGDQTHELRPAPPSKAPARRVRVKTASEAIVVAPKQPERAAKAGAPDQAAATSGEGTAVDGAGGGLGVGSGDGTGGAGFALNVDLQRIRKTALILETEALLNLVPDRKLAESRNRHVVSSGKLQRPESSAIAEGEALTLWIEGVHEYLKFESPAVPQSVRLSLVPIDQFRNELRIHADYPSSEHASEAARALQELRVQLSEHPKVIFQGLKSAVDEAQLEQRGAALVLRAQVTLHQTRYLMRHVRRALKPQNKLP